MGRRASTDQAAPPSRSTRRRPTAKQKAYLCRGLNQPGGKLPLFDPGGQRYSARTIQSCIDNGWAERWFDNPVKPNWLVCKLTPAGRALVEPGDEGTSGDTGGL